MRVTTELWVGALMRRASAEGAFATVLNKGAAEAGTVYIVVNDLANSFTLYGPATQALYDGDRQERLFEVLLEREDEAVIEEQLAKERSFDPDLWIVEIEDREARHFLQTEPL